MKTLSYLSAFLISLFLFTTFSACGEQIGDESLIVHWTNVPKGKFPHDTIRLSIPAQGGEYTLVGDSHEVLIYKNRNHDFDSVIESPMTLPTKNILSDTAIAKNITVMLHRNRTKKMATLQIKALPNPTTTAIRLKLIVSIFPVSEDRFVITQEPMTTTEGKNRSGNNMK